jgi:hypothetical protein
VVAVTTHRPVPPLTPKRRKPRLRKDGTQKVHFRPEWPTWSWQGITAFILANTICGGITILIFGVIINIQNQPMPENIGGMLTAVIAALIGSVATFLGRIGTNNPQEQQGPKSEEKSETGAEAKDAPRG